MNISLQSKIEGLLYGAAVGDAIGLPTEGMTPAKIKKLGWTDPLRHRFLFSRGMWSDDTEQSIMIAQSLLSSQGDLKKIHAPLFLGTSLVDSRNASRNGTRNRPGHHQTLAGLSSFNVRRLLSRQWLGDAHGTHRGILPE